MSAHAFRVKAITTSVGVAEKPYIPVGVIAAVIGWLPADKLEWKLLFAMSRYVGLRLPSEIENMTIADIDWEANAITIHSPKTKRHPGGAKRKAPIASELSGLLLTQVESLPEGEAFVLPRLRRHANLGTRAKKYVERAGQNTWPEFWNTLRASCETDMMDTYGLSLHRQ